MRRQVSMLLALAGTAACSQPTGDTLAFHFDRPSDMTFGCVAFAEHDAGLGDAGVTDAGAFDASFFDAGPPPPVQDPSRSVAVPLAFCARGPAYQDAGVTPPGLVGLAVQTTRDEVVVALLGNGDVIDSDPLTPGQNGLSVGHQPVSADTTADGCHAVVANAGSCDLSLIDIFRASAPVRDDDVFNSEVSVRLAIQATGGQLAAAPAQVLAPPSSLAPLECTETSDPGHAYVVFPDCHLVAQVDLQNGEILSSLTVPSIGAPVVAGGDVACAAACDEIDAPASAAAVAGGEPVALAIDDVGAQIYVAARNRSSLFVVTLNATGGFDTVTEVPLEGAVGLTRVVVSPEVEIGQNDVGGRHRFVYAIGRDHAVHVVEVTAGVPPVECDTQIDARHLIGFTAADVGRLSCFPVGDPTNPPRRATARGPGIRLLDNVAPFDVAFLPGGSALDELDPASPLAGQPHPQLLNGLFAVVLGRSQDNRGVAFYINVDDDNYEDVEEPAASPEKVDMSLAMPHTLREARVDRRHPLTNKCFDQSLDTQTAGSLGPPRLFGAVLGVAGARTNTQVNLPADQHVEGAELADRLLPMLHQEVCEFIETVGSDMIEHQNVVFQPSAFAPADVRQSVFADLRNLTTQVWTVEWEGLLEPRSFASIRNGGVVQVDLVTLELTLADGSGRFCELGAEERDIVQLVGCGNEGDCGVGETCVLHPEAPLGATGMCLDSQRIEDLSRLCQPIMVSNRKYLIKAVPGAVHKDHLTLVPKPATLRSTPLDGCQSDAQCAALYQYQLDSDPADGSDPSPEQTWDCRPDAATGGPSRCIATCPGNRDEECPVGSVCQDLVCIEGAFVPQECLASAQQYDVRAGGAFTVVGSANGYLHNRLLDDATGLCVDDAAQDPLLVGRFRPDEPACDSADGPVPTGPNPCSVDLSEPLGLTQGDGSITFGRRKSRGIRFRNIALRLDIADVVAVHPGADPLIAGVLQAAYPLGYFFDFVVAGGFFPRLDDIGSTLPVRARAAPNGAVWVIDAGDAFTTFGLRRGQLVQLTEFGVSSAID